MTRENAKALLPIIKAYAEGKVIQIINPSGQWIDSNEPIFNCDYSCYRIKQKVKFRPFANAEECWEEMMKHQPFGWVKDNETQSFFVCKAFGNLLFSIGIEDKPYNYNEVLRDYTFSDGTPFGIKVEG